MPIQDGEVYHRSHFPIFLWYKKKAGIETWSKRRVVGLSVLRGVWGSGISVPESTSIVFSSSEHVSDEGPKQESLASRNLW
jgi:hypothetical protein